MKNCTPLWRKAHIEVKMHKTGPLLEVEMSKKVHAVEARSTFASEKAKNTDVRTTFGS